MAVAEALVDGREVDEVEEDDAQARLVAARAAHHVLAEGVEATPVVEAGELVGEGEHAQLLLAATQLHLGALLRGDVDDVALVGRHRTLRAPHGVGVVADPACLAGRVDEPVLLGPRLEAAARLLVAVVGHPGAVVGVDHAVVGPASADELVGAVPEDGDVGGDVLHRALVVDVPAEGDQRSGDQQVAFALEGRLHVLAALDLGGEALLPFGQLLHHGVERPREVAHEVDALTVVAAGDLAGLPGEPAEMSVQLDERHRHGVVGGGQRRRELAVRQGQHEHGELFHEADEPVDRLHQRLGFGGAGGRGDALRGARREEVVEDDPHGIETLQPRRARVLRSPSRPPSSDLRAVYTRSGGAAGVCAGPRRTGQERPRARVRAAVPPSCSPPDEEARR